MDHQYITAFDDSGGIEPLIKPNLCFRKGDRPIVTVAAVSICVDHLNEFNDRWNELRGRIRDYLGVRDLPPIHGRLMYRKCLPVSLNNQKTKNPYSDERGKPLVPFTTTVSWLTEALAILNDFIKRKEPARLFWDSHNRAELVKRYLIYMRNDPYREEFEFIPESTRRHSVRDIS